MVRIELITLLDAPAVRVFDLARSVDAQEASMRAEGGRAVAGTLTGPLELGGSVTWRARHFGIWWRLQSRVTACDPPHRFVDEQVRGPLRRWHHEHLFRWDADRGVTVMRDVIDLAAPGGPLGWLVERLVLRRHMRALVLRRNAFLSRHAVLD